MTPHKTRTYDFRKTMTLVGLCATALAATATECVWNGASGDWGDAAGWQDGVKPSASGDTVVVNGAGVAVTVRDADIDNFVLVTKITVASADSRIVIDTTGDVATPAEFLGSGKLVKTGTSKLDLQYAGIKGSYYAAIGAFGELVISNGTVQLPNRTSAMGLTDWLHVCKLSVWKPGILSLGNSPYTGCSKGLWGDGTVTNGNSGCQFYLECHDLANPPVFAGNIQPKVQLTVSQDATNGAAVQYLTGEGSSCDLTLRLDGWVGTSKFGMKSESSSPIGTTATIAFRTKNSRLIYLGTEDETTDKSFGFPSARGTIDAGAHGGVTFNSEWYLSSYTSYGPNYKCNTICLTGSNEVPCVVNASMYEMTNRASSYWLKEGTGTWKLATGGKKGTFDVRRGTLQFTSLAERGTDCALGTAELTFEDGTYLSDTERLLENMKANHTVPYAIRLGEANVSADEDHIATLEYVGSKDAICTTRPIALTGAGVIRTTGGQLSLAGATALGTGTGTLVLDGAGTNTFASVTNGAGTVNIVKRGAGLWALPKDINVGAVMAEQGTLRIGSAYTYYRWIVTSDNNGEGGQWQPQFNGFALMDKDGNMVNGTVGANDMANTKCAAPQTLLPGEICEYGTVRGSHNGRTPAKGFRWLADAQKFETAAANWYATPKNGDPTTYPGVYFRPDEGVTVAKYDIYSYGDSSGSKQAVAQWELAGSEDGMNWDVLHTVDASNMPTMPRIANRWNSDDGSGKTPSKGYDIAIGNTNGAIRIASVGAAPGATVSFVGTATGMSVSNLVLSANGGGTITGATFAETGTISIKDWGLGKYGTKIAIDLSGSAGCENLANWKILADGKQLNKEFLAESDGITVSKRGLMITVW